MEATCSDSSSAGRRRDAVPRCLRVQEKVQQKERMGRFKTSQQGEKESFGLGTGRLTIEEQCFIPALPGPLSRLLIALFSV